MTNAESLSSSEEVVPGDGASEANLSEPEATDRRRTAGGRGSLANPGRGVRGSSVAPLRGTGVRERTPATRHPPASRARIVERIQRTRARIVYTRTCMGFADATP
jgi:hypothetical protein